MKELLKYICVF